MSKINILIPDVVKPPADIEKEILGSEANIFIGEATDAKNISDDKWAACDAILAYDQIVYDIHLLSKLNNCKAIVRVGVGFDNVDISEAKKRNIIVCNIPDYGIEEVADHTFALLLSLVRGLPEYTKRVSKRDWSRANPMTTRLRGKIMGIIGLGRIGTAVAMRAKVFGMKVIFYDPYVKDGYDKALGIERVDTLEEIAENSNFISLHTPLTEETENMINDEFLSHVTKEVILINTARGAIIDFLSLEKGLREGIVKAVGLDVLPIEPSDDSQLLIVAWEKNELWLQGRLIVSPHVAFYTPEAFVEMRRKAAIEIKRIFEGKPPRNSVNGF